MDGSLRRLMRVTEAKVLSASPLHGPATLAMQRCSPARCWPETESLRRRSPSRELIRVLKTLSRRARGGRVRRPSARAVSLIRYRDSVPTADSWVRTRLVPRDHPSRTTYVCAANRKVRSRHLGAR